MWKTCILPGNTYVCLGKPRQGLENVRVCLGKTSKIMDQILGINLSEITAPVFYCLSKKKHLHLRRHPGSIEEDGWPSDGGHVKVFFCLSKEKHFKQKKTGSLGNVENMHFTRKYLGLPRKTSARIGKCT